MSSEEQAGYSEAGAVVTEVISSIRTVAAFGGEHEEIERLVSSNINTLLKWAPTGFCDFI